MAREPADRGEPHPYKVLLVDDSEAYRRALSLALSRDKSIQIVGEAADGKSALDLHARLHPDIVLMDVMMPRMDGIETAHALLRSSSTAILLLSIIVRYPEHRSALDKLPIGRVDLMDKPVLVGPAGEANTAALIRRICRPSPLAGARKNSAPIGTVARLAGSAAASGRCRLSL